MQVSAPSNKISKEFYWLGFVIPNEKEFGTATNPAACISTPHVHENDSLEMQLVEKICQVKFIRNKPQKDCSNCHQSFTSKGMKKNWVYDDYFTFELLSCDSTSQLRWYKPHFRQELISDATDHEKLSFLAGTFLRCGKADNTSLILTIDESPEKSICIQKTLDYFKCENVTPTSLENIPKDGIVLDNRTIIRFTPSPLITSFIEAELEIRSLRADL